MHLRYLIVHYHDHNEWNGGFVFHLKIKASCLSRTVWLCHTYTVMCRRTHCCTFSPLKGSDLRVLIEMINQVLRRATIGYKAHEIVMNIAQNNVITHIPRRMTTSFQNAVYQRLHWLTLQICRVKVNSDLGVCRPGDVTATGNKFLNSFRL